MVLSVLNPFLLVLVFDEVSNDNCKSTKIIRYEKNSCQNDKVL